MENDLKIALLISVLFHLSLFFATTVRSNRVMYVTMPVELFYYATPAPPSVAAGQPAVQQKKEEEIAVPKKTKKEPAIKKTEKKAEKKTEEPAAEPKKEAAGVSPAAARPLVPVNQISLENARFPYAYYTNMLVKKIGRQWEWSIEFGQLKSIIYFKILRSGSITNIEVKTSSGDKYFDQQAVRAVTLAAPFPPLPAGYPDESLGVFFEFAFKE